MTIRTMPGGAAPAPVIVPPGVPTPGRAERGLPLRREGPEKLTGLARYADDLVFPGAWFGATVRSHEPRARLLAIELDPAFDWGDIAVVTADDIPGVNVVSLITDDQPVLVPLGGEIQHREEPVCLLASADRDRLREARRHVTLRTEPLPPVFDPAESEHSFASYRIARGDAEAALARADLVIEGTYRVGHQEQLYIENQAMIAVPREDGGVTIHGSCQCPYYIHAAMTRALDMTAEQVVIIQSETGGGFGGKEEYPSMIALHAALLSLKAGRPVRMIYDRHEDISATTKRHPAVVRYRTGVGRDGALVAQVIEVLMDAGAYCTLSPVVLSRGVLHAGGPYACADVLITGKAVATNTPPNGAFRGFGAPQAEFAAEMQVNRVAEQLGRLTARAAPPLGLSRGQRDAHRAGAARERGGTRGARGRDGIGRVRAPAAPDRPGAGAADQRRPGRLRHRAGHGLARRRLHRGRRGSPRQRGVRGADR